MKPFPDNILLFERTFSVNYLAGQHHRQTRSAYLMKDGLPLVTVDVNIDGSLTEASRPRAGVALQSLEANEQRYSIRPINPYGMFSGKSHLAAKAAFYEEQLTHAFVPEEDLPQAELEYYNYYGVAHATVTLPHRCHPDKEPVVFILWDDELITQALKETAQRKNKANERPMMPDDYNCRKLSSLAERALASLI
jgi:hypothetical protein